MEHVKYVVRRTRIITESVDKGEELQRFEEKSLPAFQRGSESFSLFTDSFLKRLWSLIVDNGEAIQEGLEGFHGHLSANGVGFSEFWLKSEIAEHYLLLSVLHRSVKRSFAV